ncbi:MAG TPA: TonB-dependent receptor, partial [Phenylobacterium sp.]|nr:TonB-dependent receptor [Phenylobacterium sp.]
MILILLAQAAAAAAGAPPPVPVAQPPGAVAAPAVSQPAEPEKIPPREGVTTYGPDFFAAYRPNNALEMVQRLPGFTLDTGDTVRGYEGAAGNVLIDGQRPATKADTLDQSLYRIPASAVDHIDVIRGSAPGIDMQGKTVIANVVRKNGGAFHGLLAAQDTYLKDGRNYWAVRAEGTGKAGPGTWEGGVFAGEGQDGGLGDGPLSQVSPSGQPLQAGRIHVQGEAFNLVANGAVEEPLWGGRIRLNTRINSQPYDSDETDFITAPTVQQQTEHQDDNVFQTEFGARYTHALGGRASLETVLLRQDKHERYNDDFRQVGDRQLFHLDDRTAESIARAVVSFPQNARLSWEGGAEVAYNTLESATTFSDNGAPVALPASNVVVQEKRAEVFGKATWRVLPTVTLEGGLREEGSNISSARDVVLDKTLYYTKPRVVVTWQAL